MNTTTYIIIGLIAVILLLSFFLPLIFFTTPAM